jgi:hypothetical protein
MPNVMIKSTWQRLAVTISGLAIAIMGVIGLAAPQASASVKAPELITSCRTVSLTEPWYYTTIRPHMSVPICWNGQRVWKAGGVTPGVTLLGYTKDGNYQWFGTYTDASQNFLGAGENFEISFVFKDSSVTFSCDPRWLIGTEGQVYYTSPDCDS